MEDSALRQDIKLLKANPSWKTLELLSLLHGKRRIYSAVHLSLVKQEIYNQQDDWADKCIYLLNELC